MPIIDLGSVVGPQGPQGATGAAGAQGVQGPAGPNQVTAATSTTFGSANYNAVLIGNGSKVGSKSFDSEPTENSQNMLTSGAVFTGLEARMRIVQNRLEAGQTLTITLPQNANYGAYGIQIMCSGTAAGQHAFLIAIGRGNNTSYHVLQQIITGSLLTVTDNGGTLTITNNHGSWGVNVTTAVFFDSAPLSFAVS